MQAKVDLDFDQNDPENPRNFLNGKKAFITFTTLISTFIAYVQTHTILVTCHRYSVEERMDGILTEAKSRRNSHLHRQYSGRDRRIRNQHNLSHSTPISLCCRDGIRFLNIHNGGRGLGTDDCLSSISHPSFGFHHCRWRCQRVLSAGSSANNS
jgi:hypothetical protein